MQSPVRRHRIVRTLLTTLMLLGIVMQGVRAAELISRQVELPDCSLHVRSLSGEESADGPLFILINGVPTTSLIYRKLALNLQRDLGARVRLVDLPGTGGSRLLNPGSSWGRQQLCLQGFLERMPEHVLLVHDAAGPVAIPTLAHQDSTRALIALNTILKPSLYDPQFPMNCFRGCGPFARPFSYLMNGPMYARKLRKIGLSDPDAVDSDFIDALYAELNAEDGMQRLVDVMKGYELDEHADRAMQAGLASDIPQLFLWGGADPVLGREHARISLNQGNRKLQVFEDAKHYLMLDHASQISAAITDWLK